MGSGTDSAGLAVCRPSSGSEDALVTPEDAEVLLVHPGGPFWAGKDINAWSIPKGEFDPDDESSESAARREFQEELGVRPPSGAASFLGTFRAGRKTIWTWLLVIEGPSEATLDQPVGTPFAVQANSFEMEWPPRSGRTAVFPEVDLARWVAIADAGERLHKGQYPLVDLLQRGLNDYLADPESFENW